MPKTQISRKPFSTRAAKHEGPLPHPPGHPFNPIVLEPGKHYRVPLGTFGDSDWIEVMVDPDGQAIGIRTGEGGVVVRPESANKVTVRRGLFPGDTRKDPHGL